MILSRWITELHEEGFWILIEFNLIPDKKISQKFINFLRNFLLKIKIRTHKKLFKI